MSDRIIAPHPPCKRGEPVKVLISAIFALFFCVPALAQSGAVNGVPTMVSSATGGPMRMTEASLTFQAPPRQRVFDVGDVIYVHVKEKKSYSSTANNQRRKKIETLAELAAWTKVSGLFKMPLAAAGESLPEIGGKIDHKTQNQGRLVRDEMLDFTIACMVTSVHLDNGNLVITGNKDTGIGEEGGLITVTGIVRPDTIGPDYRIESSQVADLVIREVPSGNVYDTVRRPWGTRFMEHWKPF